jgi:signal transduction histidine kinase
LALVLPLLVAVVAGSTLAIRALERTWNDRVHDQLAAAIGLLAEGDLPFTPALLERFASLQEADFAVVDTGGHVSLSTYRQLPPEVVEAAREFVQQGAPERDLAFEIDAVPHLMLLRQISDRSASPYGAVLAVRSLAVTRVAAARAGGLLALALLVTSLLVGVVGYFLVRGITRPIERVAQMADRIALGERDLRLDLERTDEVGALARAVDSMAGKLATYERELEARARLGALGELAARTAHEIRNPLTAIKLHLQLLAERLAPAEAARVERVLAEVRRLELVADTTLALGQDQPLATAPTDLGGLAAEVVELMQPALAHRGIRIEARIASHGLRELDPRKLKQVLLNLIINAADAAGDGGWIRVTAEVPAAGPARLIVEDSGAGIPPQKLAALFAGGASDKPFGFGLGLVVSRDIVLQHGGRLQAQSSPELGGARFLVELPALAGLAELAG